MKYIAAVLVVALLVVGAIASYFLNNGYTVRVQQNLDVEIGVDHKPTPIIQYHIEKKGVWGV